MLQRIQTVFLLLAAVAMAMSAVMPFLILDSGRIVFEAKGIVIEGVLNKPDWFLFFLSMTASLLALITIFLYKKRKLQIRLTQINIVLMLGFYCYLGFGVYQYSTANPFLYEKVGIGVILPLVAIVFSLLSIRRISADEALVRSLNRLRG